MTNRRDFTKITAYGAGSLVTAGGFLEAVSADEEFARYDFRMGASLALGGGAVVAQPSVTKAAASKPPIKIAPKKKKAAGGC